MKGLTANLKYEKQNAIPDHNTMKFTKPITYTKQNGILPKHKIKNKIKYKWTQKSNTKTNGVSIPEI